VLLMISYEFQPHDDPDGAKRVSAIQSAISAAALDQLQPLSSHWLVETDEDVDQWTDRLTKLTSQSDRLLICRVQGRTNGWLSTDIWEWINQRAG